MAHPAPQFLEGERAVLGALILDNEAFGRVQGVLRPDDFYDSINRSIFEAIIRLTDEGQPIDLVTLTGAMKDTSPESRTLLIDLTDEVPSAANVLHYARHVKDRALKRKIIAAGRQIAKSAVKPEAVAESLLAEFDELLGDVRNDFVAINEDTLWRVRKDTESLLDLEEKILAKEIIEERLPSGFLDVDHYTGGFFPGNVIVIAGRSGMGKTAFALDMTWHMAKLDLPCLYCSFEMTRPEVARRLIAKECHVNILDLKRHSLSPSQLQYVRNKMDRVTDAPVLVDERNLIPSEIGSQVIRLNNRHQDKPIKVLCVDHLQLMGVRDQYQYQRRDLQLGSYMMQLKELAKRLDLVVIVLSQLNRQVSSKDRRDRLPKRSDLRDSGAIEENADVILGIHREFEDTKDSDDEFKAEAVLVKNRDGPTGKIKLCWKGEWATFTNLAKSNGPEPMERIRPEPEPEEEIPTRIMETQEGTYDLF